jgi:membrane-bound serine protease (ClpP class)
VIGIALIAVSLIMAMVGLPLSTSWEVGDLGTAMTTVVLALFGTGIASIVVIRYLPGSSIGKWLILETTLGGSSTGAFPSTDEPTTPGTLDNRRHLDACGTALTDLRPSGKMQYNDEVIDVVSRDQWVERGAPIKVVAVEGIRVVVVEED